MISTTSMTIVIVGPSPTTTTTTTNSIIASDRALTTYNNKQKTISVIEILDTLKPNLVD
jgi:hypothetical protein